MPKFFNYLQQTGLIIASSFLCVSCQYLPLKNSQTNYNAKQYQISKQYLKKSTYANNGRNKPNFLIFHYTAETLDQTLNLFLDPEWPASSHYIVPKQNNGNRFNIYEIVPEHRQAWHAGSSYWRGQTALNTQSLGIEIVNMGYAAADQTLAPMQRHWYPFQPKIQITALAELAKSMIDFYQIHPTQVLGHSDIAPQRKSDPGPLFPWQLLYQQYAIGAWYDHDTVAYYQSKHPWQGDIAELQYKLACYGYQIEQTSVLDEQSINVISAFQMHFNPEKYDGIPDALTVAKLDALLAKYANPCHINSDLN